MAEEFEGPVIVKRPAGQPQDFEVANFHGDVRLDGTVRTTHVSAEGNISARGNVNANFLNVGEDLFSNQGLPDQEVAKFNGIIRTTHVSAEGNISARGNVNGKFVNVQDTIRTTNLLSKSVTADENLFCKRDITSQGTIFTQHLRAEGNISAINNVNAKRMFVEEDVILANGAGDCAEEFDLEDPSVGDAPGGSVMVIGEEGSVRLSTSPYDKRVAGVVSGAGPFRPGIILDRRISDCTRPVVALMGKVFCKVDTTNGPIDIGDLLTTSSTPGYAMRATDSSRAFGAVIGKALRPLREAQGLIPILVALQ
jgi:hypothetical protein